MFHFILQELLVPSQLHHVVSQHWASSSSSLGGIVRFVQNVYHLDSLLMSLTALLVVCLMTWTLGLLTQNYSWVDRFVFLDGLNIEIGMFDEKGFGP